MLAGFSLALLISIGPKGEVVVALETVDAFAIGASVWFKRICCRVTTLADTLTCRALHWVPPMLELSCAFLTLVEPVRDMLRLTTELNITTTFAANTSAE